MCRSLVRFKDLKTALRDGVSCTYSLFMFVQLLAVLTVLGGRTCASEAKAAKEMEIEKD